MQPSSIAGHLALAALKVGTTITREPIRTTFSGAAAVDALLAATGWSVTRRVLGRDLGMARATAGLLYVTATACRGR
jgi:hypothetical protein